MCFRGLPEYSESAVFHRLVSWETRPRVSARCHLPLATLSPFFFFFTAFLCILLCYFSPRSPPSTFCQMLSEADNSEIEPAPDSIAGGSQKSGVKG